MPPDHNRSRLASLVRRYGFAAGMAGIAVAFRHALFPWVAGDVPFLLLLVPIVVVTWYGGLGPGLLSAALLCTAGIYYFLPPYGTWQFTHDSGIRAVVFGIECAIMAALTAVARAGHCRTRDTARRMTAIYKISAALGGTHTIDDVAAVILDEAIRVLGVDGVALYIGAQSSGTLRLEGILARDPRWVPLTRVAALKKIRFDDDGAVALAARSRDVVAFENQEQFRRQFSERAKVVNEEIPQAMMHAPMLVHGHTVGVFTMVWAKPRRFSEADRAWARGVAQDCAHAVERTRLFAAERRARIQAEDATRAQEAFFSSVSQELRAPLMSILGWAHTLNSGRRPDRALQQRGLDMIESGARAQTNLIDDVIEVSRLSSRRVRVDVKSAEVAVLVRSWLGDAREAAQAKGVTLESGPQAKAVVAVDMGRLRVAMRKVLADALDGSRRGGAVRVESEVRDDRVHIRVRHQGSAGSGGKPVQASTARKDGGSHAETHFGLNLAIANVVVQQHGGTISVDRGGADGVTVTLDLPVLDAMAGVLATSSGEAAEATVPLSGARVLLVDDDNDAREALGRLLAADGAEVRSEASAKAGLAALSAFEPTVIVSDIQMPDEDGYWFIRAVRALPSASSSVPAVALSGRTGGDDGDAALDAGFQRRLAKPPQPQELSDVIAEMHASRTSA